MPQKIQHPCRIPPPNQTKIEFENLFLTLLFTLFKTVADTFMRFSFAMDPEEPPWTIILGSHGYVFRAVHVESEIYGDQHTGEVDP